MVSALTENIDLFEDIKPKLLDINSVKQSKNVLQPMTSVQLQTDLPCHNIKNITIKTQSENIQSAQASKQEAVRSDHGRSSANVDEGLTSLEWLQNLNIMSKVGAPTPPTPPASPLMPSDKPCPGNFLAKFTMNKKIPSVDYKTNPKVKPPFSYANLICMAMKENNNKMTLAAIYKWIRENFVFYKNADHSWKNSIRHNLSLNKCFVKVPRRKDEPGKGGFWKLDPLYAESMFDGTFKKRRMSHRCPTSVKKPAKKKNENVLIIVDKNSKNVRHAVPGLVQKSNIITCKKVIANKSLQQIQVISTDGELKPKSPTDIAVQELLQKHLSEEKQAKEARDAVAAVIKQEEPNISDELPSDDVMLKNDFPWQNLLPEDLDFTNNAIDQNDMSFDSSSFAVSDELFGVQNEDESTPMKSEPGLSSDVSDEAAFDFNDWLVLAQQQQQNSSHTDSTVQQFLPLELAKTCSSDLNDNFTTSSCHAAYFDEYLKHSSLDNQIIDFDSLIDLDAINAY